VISTYSYIDELYGKFGVLQHHLISAMVGESLTFTSRLLAQLPLDQVQYLFFVRIVLNLYIFGLIGLLVGYKTRVAAIIVWFCHVLIINFGYLSIYGVDRYVHVFLFYFMFMPVGKKLSIDSMLNGKKTYYSVSAGLSLRLLQIHLALTYANAGIAKMMGQDWWSGEAIWRSTNLPEFSQIDMTWLAFMPFILKILSLGTLFFEAGYPLLVIHPITRLITIPSIIAMHLGIALVMGLQIFGATLILFNICLFLIPFITGRIGHTSLKFG
jgi:hypothetical protein